MTKSPSTRDEKDLNIKRFFAFLYFFFSFFAYSADSKLQFEINCAEFLIKNIFPEKKKVKNNRNLGLKIHVINIKKLSYCKIAYMSKKYWYIFGRNLILKLHKIGDFFCVSIALKSGKVGAVL